MNETNNEIENILITNGLFKCKCTRRSEPYKICYSGCIRNPYPCLGKTCKFYKNTQELFSDTYSLR